MFAFGTSRGIMLMDKDSAGLAKYIEYGENGISPSDVFALEFLHNNPFVLLSGERNSTLNMTDLRAPTYSLMRSTNNLIHPSSITHIKSLNQHQIIVAGLHSTLCLYDLRYRKEKDRPWMRKPITTKNNKSTIPIVEYPEYHNQATFRIGFDVDIESGVVAACQEQQLRYYPPVQLFSLKGGHALPTPRHPVNVNERPTWTTAAFIQDTRSKFKSLYLGTDKLYRFAWSNEWDDSDV